MRYYVCLVTDFYCKFKMAWSNNKTFTFIELYRSEPAIWNPQHPLHKDRKEVQEAWIRIADSIQEPVVELKRKKESLMTAFRINLKKKQDSIHSNAGDIFKPIWLFYDAMEDFLKDVYECRSTSIISEDRPALLEQDASFSEEFTKQEIQVEENPPNFKGNPAKKHKTEVPRKKIYPVQPEYLDIIDASEEEKVHTFNRSNQFLKKEEKVEDDCELYGKLLACKLRKYSESERQEIMYEIDGIMLERYRNKMIKRRSPSGSPSYIYPTSP